MNYLYEQIIKAKNHLFNHGVICFPTETVMGLGVLFNDYDAYKKLNIIKKRPEDKPYTMMVKDINEISKYAIVDEKIKGVIGAFMPGSLTLLLKAKENVPNYVTHNSGVIGIRIPTNKEAVDLLNEIDIPLLVPSANISGEKPALNSEEAKKIFNDEVIYINGVSKGEIPSTIVDLSHDEPKLIRNGPLSFEGIKTIYNGHKFDDTVICYLIKNDEVLMMLRNKKEVDINKGKWIGVGGHIEKGESATQAIIREFKEETSLDISNVKEVATIYFRFNDDFERMQVFTCVDYQGEVNFDCVEGTLKWLSIDKLFDYNLWEGDKLFLKPIFNSTSYFEMDMRYDGDSLVEYKYL